MMKLVWIGLGGGLGAVARYLIGGWAHQLTGVAAFPIGTLTANLLGCLLIGFFGGVSEARHVFTPEMRLFLFVGLLGGFTTFSTFGLETFQFMREGQWAYAFANVALQLVSGLCAVWLGMVIAQRVAAP